MASFSDQFNPANRDIFGAKADPNAFNFGSFGNTDQNASPLGFDYNKSLGGIEGIDAIGGDKSPGSSWSLWGGGDKNSIVGTGVGLAGAGLDAFLGLKQLGLAEDALDFKKSSFSQQFENQRSLVNTELRDRQAARVSANPTGHLSVDDYMKQSGI